MAHSLEMIQHEVFQLPEDQRITLAHRILTNAEPLPSSAIDAAWDKEIVERIERLDQGLSSRHNAADVFQELDCRLGR